MLEGRPSLTAQRVAAYRVGFERVPAPFGDPEADLRLTADVAAGAAVDAEGPLTHYLRARTGFFDRVVINALGRGVRQVLVVGAGYDGRSLRYAKDGVRWFEVDHPDTQRDKRLRIERLAIDAPNVTFVSVDLSRPGLAGVLLDHGYEADAPSVLVCEGVIAYLDQSTLVSLLDELRATVTTGTRFAFSLSAGSASSEAHARRERLKMTVAQAGEPIRLSLDPARLADVLSGSRWRLVEVSERAGRAGLWVAAPDWRPPSRPAASGTLSRVGAFMDRLHGRLGSDELPGHLGRTYRIPVSDVTELDAGVFRVGRPGGADWVARVFPAERAVEDVSGDAELLAWLARTGFPSERCAHDEPVSELHGQSVLVTEFVPGPQPARTGATFAELGRLLAQLHLLPATGGPVPAAARRPGGGWHSLVLQGTPRDELDSAMVLLRSAEQRVGPDRRPLYRRLVEALERAEDCMDLPHALIHPDCVPDNAIASKDRGLLLIDWASAGYGPRLWALGFLLWAAGRAHAGAVASAYGAHATLEPAELDRLAAAIAARALVFTSWSFASGANSLEESVAGIEAVHARSEQIAGLARAGLDPGRPCI